MTPTEASDMTCPDVLKVKAIAALIEAGDGDDPKDAAEVLRLIRAILGPCPDKEAR